MTKERIKKLMDARYLAKRVRDMLPKLPKGVTSTHIHYLDTISQLEIETEYVKISDISDKFGLPRPSVTKTIKNMEKLGFVEKYTTQDDGRVVVICTTESGKDLVDKYGDQYFGELSKELHNIFDKEAEITIKTIEELYEVMKKRR